MQVIGTDDKRQITAVFGATLSGEFLCPQLIYKGTTTKCLRSVRFPPDWHITFTENHWSNESTMEDYLDKFCCHTLTGREVTINWTKLTQR